MKDEIAICRYIPESDYVMAGWGCCLCDLYNGAWRKKCKGCGHLVCVEVPADVAESQKQLAISCGGGVE